MIICSKTTLRQVRVSILKTLAFVIMTISLPLRQTYGINIQGKGL